MPDVQGEFDGNAAVEVKDADPSADGCTVDNVEGDKAAHDAENKHEGSLSKRSAAVLRAILGKVTTEKWEQDKDLDAEGQRHRMSQGWGTTFFLAYQALGVVYGDIGTSPLYVFSSIFSASSKSTPPTDDDLVGATSLVVYVLTAIILIKYCLIVLRADDHGNGGTFALYSLLKRTGDFRTFGPALDQDRHVPGYSKTGPKYVSGVDIKNTWRTSFLQKRVVQGIIRVLVVIGVGAIMGDGVLTPSMSVLSASEGLQREDGTRIDELTGKLIPPTISREGIVWLTLAILTVLFLIQRFGTEAMGVTFSPIVSIWFLANIVIGIANIIRFDAGILRAFSPHYIVIFFKSNGFGAWRMLGGVLLAVTGAEAMYADLGHFSRASIFISCVGLVYPALVVTYLGQGACLLDDPGKVSKAFWKCLPKFLYWPMFIVATLSAIVASQALISAVFQLVYQAIGQDFFPKVHVVHTSKKVVGQIYIPSVNYVLMVLTLVVVGVFQTSEKLGQAYGLAVIIDMLLTTQFITLVMLFVWNIPVYLALVFYIFYALLEGVLLSASAEKIPHGGWFSIMMASVYAVNMLIWFWGNRRKREYFKARETTLQELLYVENVAHVGGKDRLFLRSDSVEVTRCEGVGLYYSESIYGVPPLVVQQMKAFHCLHRVSIFLTNRNIPVPTVDSRSSLLVNELGVQGVYHAVARYGYMDKIVQEEKFVNDVLEHVLNLLLRALYHCVATSEKLRELVGSDIRNRLAVTSHTVQDTIKALKFTEALARSVSMDTPTDSTTTSQEDIASIHGLEENQQHTINAQGGGLFKLGGLNKSQVTALMDVVNLLLDNPPKTTPGDEDKLGRSLLQAAEIRTIVSVKADLHKHVQFVFARSYVRAIARTKERAWLPYLSKLLRTYILEIPFDIMVRNFADEPSRLFNVPKEELTEIGLGYEL